MEEMEYEKTAAPKKLNYTVVRCSSFSSSYRPENVLEDKPGDLNSRWSSESNTPPQFIILKLQRLSIVQKITFGKYEKNHVCNLKQFKVFGGMLENHTFELLDGGLKNDTQPETFTLNHEIDGNPFPCRYIKIIPVQTWGPAFNFSIWYVGLYGIDDHELVQPCATWFNAYREREALRLCLKHLRDRNYMEAFQSLQKKTKFQFEHPLITELYNILVIRGDYVGAEEFLERCAENGLFHEHISRQDYKARWGPLSSDLPEVSCNSDPAASMRPGCRGGHQMCIDPTTGTVYLFGGWDGNQDLADFWSFNVSEGKWTLISKNTENEGGPSPRSCHKLCLDPVRRQIFILGRYVDVAISLKLQSDFYVFDIESNKWTLITDDTAAMGGPELVFDHQMCIDEDRQIIYVFGGRILTDRIIDSLNPNLNAVQGQQIMMGVGMMYDRDEGGNFFPRQEGFQRRVAADDLAAQIGNGDVPIFDGQLNLEAPIQRRGFPGDGGRRGDNLRGIRLRPENPNNNNPTNGGAAPVSSSNASSPSSANSELLYSGLYAYHIATNTWSLLRCDVASPKPTRKTIRSRVGHSMLFHPGIRKLYIYAGQRSKEYLNDFFSYHVDNDTLEMICDGQKKILNNNAPSPGFTQRATIDPELNEIYIFSGFCKDRDKRDDVQNSFWVFNINRKSWSCVYKNDASSEAGWVNQQAEPCPRFAHQLVYDHLTKVHYLFGGNPGRSKDPTLRLDDFWSLRLIRPSVENLLKQCKLTLRRQRYEELATANPLGALKYLQTSLSELIDHRDSHQAYEFQRLPLHLFVNEEQTADKLPFMETEEYAFLQRTKDDEQIFKRSELFDQLVHYFPESMTQPKLNLVDIIPISTNS